MLVNQGVLEHYFFIVADKRTQQNINGNFFFVCFKKAKKKRKFQANGD